MTIPQAYSHALQHHQAGRLAEAEALYRQILGAQPSHADALHHLGVIAHQRGRQDLAVKWIQQAVTLQPNNSAAHCNLGEAWRALGRLDEAIDAYRRALELKSDAPEVHATLGNTLRERGRLKEAAAAYRRALEYNPNAPEIYNNLGAVLAEQDQLEEAIAACRRALQLKPDLPEAHNNLGNALIRKREFDEAAAEYRRALQFRPGYPEAWNNLGNALKECGENGEALIAYRRALQINPDYAEAHYNLGNVLKLQGRLDEALDAFRRALQLDPAFAKCYNNMGNALKDIGELEQAFTAYRRGIDLQPTDPGALSNLIFGMPVSPACDARSLWIEQARWNRLFVEPLRTSWQPHDNDPDPARKLRIGYVSPDFRFHPVAFFLTPLLEAHDRQACEIYCYADVDRPDAITERLRKSADVWQDVRALSDDSLAERIRGDGIDILVDLAMHTSGNRLPVFARQPAPVQVSWLAYPGTTGVETIRYRISDRWLEAENSEFGVRSSEIGAPWAESISELRTSNFDAPLRLPGSWCCYAPIAEFPPVSPLPAVRRGFVAFGAQNQFAKSHEGLLRCWAKLIAAVPVSRLLMVCPEGQTRERVRALFASHGVAEERLHLVASASWAEYLRRFEEIDLALDSYPCNGMTTTCHALWMGVPVITLPGASAVSRAGSSLLHTVGLPELVAHTEEEYRQIALAWASDLPRLAELRATLRSRMAASTLMDAPLFARHIETAYRSMWQGWCEQNRISRT